MRYNKDNRWTMILAWALALLAVGFVLLIKGADWFVSGASGIAKRFGIPQLVIGLTIVAMGTSAPEAAVSITAALKENADITIGNIVGSNILNILLILGISATIAPLAVAGSTVFYEIPFMLVMTFLLLVQGFDNTVGFWDGVLLLAAFAAYLTYLFFMAKKGEAQAAAAEEMAVETKKSLGRTLFEVAAGFAAIILGSRAAVDGAVTLAELFGISERFIGLTIVALGTSLPELVTSVLAAKKGNADIAIGNIVGSNIFNILFVVGISACITPVPFSTAFYVDTAIAEAAGILLFLCSLRRIGGVRKLGRAGGLLMLAGYGAYFLYLCS